MIGHQKISRNRAVNEGSQIVFQVPGCICVEISHLYADSQWKESKNQRTDHLGTVTTQSSRRPSKIFIWKIPTNSFNVLLAHGKYTHTYNSMKLSINPVQHHRVSSKNFCEVQKLRSLSDHYRANSTRDRWRLWSGFFFFPKPCGYISRRMEGCRHLPSSLNTSLLLPQVSLKA